MWRKTGSQSTWDSVGEEVLKVARTKGHEIVIGSDSQPFADYVIIVTAIAFLSEDKDLHGRFFYKKIIERKPFASLYDRILRETMASIDEANTTREICPFANISVHLDISETEAKNKTSKFCTSMCSIVRGYGFNQVEVKPYSWCASSIADALTKNKVKKLRNKTWPMLKSWSE